VSSVPVVRRKGKGDGFPPWVPVVATTPVSSLMVAMSVSLLLHLPVV